MSVNVRFSHATTRGDDTMQIKPIGSSNISRDFSIYIIFALLVDRRHSRAGRRKLRVLRHNKKGGGGRAEGLIATSRAQAERGSDMAEKPKKRPRHSPEVDPITKKAWTFG